MERVDAKATARCMSTIEMSPSDLRMMADRLDLAEKNCLPGQEIVFQVTATILGVYRPQLLSAAATGLVKASDRVGVETVPSDEAKSG